MINLSLPYLILAIIIIIFTLHIIITLYSSILIISEGNCTIVERLGRYNRTLLPGLHLIKPWLETCKKVSWTHTIEDTFAGKNRQETIHTHLISTQEILYDFPVIKVATKDRLIVELNGILFFRIVDARKAVYSITDLYQAIEQLCVTSVRDIISSMTLDEAIEGKLVIQASILKDFRAAAEAWGVQITRFDIQSLMPNTEVLKGIEMLARAQREAQAQLETDNVKNQIMQQKSQTELLLKQKEAETQAAIKKIQADSEVYAIESKASAEKMRLESLLSVKGITQELLIQAEYTKAWQAVTQMPKDGNNKLFIIPFESAKFFGSSVNTQVLGQ